MHSNLHPVGEYFKNSFMLLGSSSPNLHFLSDIERVFIFTSDITFNGLILIKVLYPLRTCLGFRLKSTKPSEVENPILKERTDVLINVNCDL